MFPFFQKSIEPSSLIYTLHSFRWFDLHPLHDSKIINGEFYLFSYLYVWFLIYVKIQASRNNACPIAKFSPYLFLKDNTPASPYNSFYRYIPHETKKDFYTYICKCEIQKHCSTLVLRYFKEAVSLYFEGSSDACVFKSPNNSLKSRP